MPCTGVQDVQDLTIIFMAVTKSQQSLTKTSRNNPSEKYQQRTLEVTTHDASPAKVPPQSCVQERNSDVH